MKNPRSDLPPSASRAPLASPSVMRLYRARAVIRGRNAPASAPPISMRATRSALAMLALLLAALPLRPSPAHAERAAAVEVAMITDLAGRVERQPRADETWASVGLDEAVALFDAMRTWERSTAELRFVDGTVVMLDEKTRLRISPMLFDPSQAPQEVQLALAAGAAEVRAGTRRLWIDTGDGAPEALEPGASVRISADAGGGVDVGVPGEPTPSDIERGRGQPDDGAKPAAPPETEAPDADRPDADRPDDPPRPFAPTSGRLDPTEVVDQVVDAVPGGAAVDAQLPGVGGVVVVVAGPGDMPGDMPDQMPPDMPPVPGLDGLTTLTDGPEGLLRDLVPGGLVTGIDDLPPAPGTGRVRVEVEIRRR